MSPVEPVTITFRLSDLTLASVTWPMLTVRRPVNLAEAPVADPRWNAADFPAGARGVVLRELSIEPGIAPISRAQGCLRYLMKQYRHCFIDMTGTFDAYRLKFSSKTRSTITRKVKKYTEHCGGQLRWTQHRTEAELVEFLQVASALAARTYQERLMGLGLPATDSFNRWACDRAREGRIRAFLLYDGSRPVSYLFCPIDEGVVEYAYLGYDPDYRAHSVGTVLQWLALEALFAEQAFRCFDFTEGESDHKRLFATHERLCANVLFVKARPSGYLLVYGHRALDVLSEALGGLLDRWGLRARLRRMLRFGLARG
jgi:CelD/BcsL family acetyltransferase involved in cellulose biosynthesis